MARRGSEHGDRSLNSNGYLIRTMDRLIQVIFHACVVFTIVIVTLICAGVISRFVFRYPLNWVPGIVTLVTDWAIFLMIGVYIYRNQGVVITYFYERFFTSKLQTVILFLVDLIILAFTTITTWYLWKAMEMGHYQSSISTLPISQNWYTAPFFAALLIGAIGTVKRIVCRDGQEEGIKMKA